MVVPVKYSMRRNRERLEEALSKVAAVQAKLPELYAQRIRMAWLNAMKLPASHYAPKSASEQLLPALNAEAGITGKTIPNRMMQNWLKWVIVKKVQDNMVVTTEPIPIERYKIKPGQTTAVPDAVVDHDELVGRYSRNDRLVVGQYGKGISPVGAERS